MKEEKTLKTLKDRQALMVKMRKQGYSITVIAKAVGRNPSTVWRYLEKAGVRYK